LFGGVEKHLDPGDVSSYRGNASKVARSNADRESGNRA